MFIDESRFAAQPYDKRIRVWRKQKPHYWPKNITEYHAFHSGSIMVWVRISLGYHTDLHTYRRDSVMDVRYLDEVLDPTVKHYIATIALSFVFIDGNERPP